MLVYFDTGGLLTGDQAGSDGVTIALARWMMDLYSSKSSLLNEIIDAVLM